MDPERADLILNGEPEKIENSEVLLEKLEKFEIFEKFEKFEKFFKLKN